MNGADRSALLIPDGAARAFPAYWGAETDPGGIQRMTPRSPTSLSLVGEWFFIRIRSAILLGGSKKRMRLRKFQSKLPQNGIKCLYGSRKLRYARSDCGRHTGELFSGLKTAFYLGTTPYADENGRKRRIVTQRFAAVRGCNPHGSGAHSFSSAYAVGGEATWIGQAAKIEA